MTEWYRNTDWNDEIEAHFFDKLSRARSQRDQYIVLQAIHLANSHPKVTERLVAYYFDTRTEDFHDPRARQALSQAKFAMGGYVEALDEFLAVLEGQETNSNIYVGSPLDFVFLTARYRSDAHYEKAIEFLPELASFADGLPEPAFRYHAARAILLSETGRDLVTALQAARMALGLQDAVLEFYPDVVWRLRGITRA